MAKRLEYEIGVDASKGVSGLKQFAGAAKKELKGVSDAVEDTSSNAEKVSKVFADMASKMETEMKQAAEAAEALGKALGPEIAGRADLDSVVADLNKMGLTFDEITADADKLATGLKELDRVGQAGFGGNLPAAAQRTKTGIDDIGQSANSSKSVLANMVGNATQDLGALGGVAGSAGVAIGQMGEYMADAASSGEGFASVLANFGKVAGPIAAVSAGLAIVSNMVASAAEDNKRLEETTRAVTDALTEQLGLRERLQAVITAGVGDEAPDFFESMTLSLLETEDAAGKGVEALGALGVGGGDLAKVLLDVDRNSRAAFKSLAVGAGVSEELAGGIAEAVDRADSVQGAVALLKEMGFDKKQIDSVIDIVTALEDLDDVQEDIDFEKTARQQLNLAKATDKATAALVDQARQDMGPDATQVEVLRRFIELQNAATTGLTDSSVRARDAAAGWTALGEATSKTPAQQKAIADALGITVAQLEDLVVAVSGAQLKLNDMASSFEEMARREGAIEAAFDLGDAPFEAEKNMSNFNVALEELAAFVREHGPPISDGLADLTKIDFAHGEVDVAPFLAKLEAVKGPIQQAVSDSFVTGGESAAQATALGLIAALSDSLDGAISPQELDKLIFGPEGFTKVIEIAVDESSLAKAKAMLQLLTGLPGADPLWTAQVLLDLQGDKITPEAAQVLIAQQLGEAGLTVPTSLLPPPGSELATAKREADQFYKDHPALMPTTAANPSNLGTVHRTAQDALNKAPLVIPVKYKITDRNPLGLDSGGTANGIGGVAAEVGPEIAQFPGSGRRVLLTEPTYVPPGTRVTSRRQTSRIMRNGGTSGLRRYDNGGIVAGPTSLNITVNAGVVGNRYDVMRVVERAGRDKIRLLGTRG